MSSCYFFNSFKRVINLLNRLDERDWVSYSWTNRCKFSMETMEEHGGTTELQYSLGTVLIKRLPSCNLFMYYYLLLV